MKLINKIKSFFFKIYVNSVVSLYDIRYIYISEDKFLIDYIRIKALELAKNENLKIFNISLNDMNKGVVIEKDKAVGKFYSLKSNHNYTALKYEYRINKKDPSVDDYNIPKDLVFPRIELSDDDVWVLLHELGHYFLYKRKLKQTEEDANKYCYEFFNNYLPSFFMWVYQIDIKVRAKEEKTFSKIEIYNYYKDYKNFKKATMLKNNNIQVGNVIASGVKYSDTSSIGVVLEIGNNERDYEQIYCECEESFDWFFKDNYCGVPLTDEWHKLLGGKKNSFLQYVYDISHFNEKEQLCLVFTGDYLYIREINDEPNTPPYDFITLWNKDIKKEFYVHEFQNLYKLLSGKEIDFKLETYFLSLEATKYNLK